MEATAETIIAQINGSLKWRALYQGELYGYTPIDNWESAAGYTYLVQALKVEHLLPGEKRFRSANIQPDNSIAECRFSTWDEARAACETHYRTGQWQ